MKFMARRVWAAQDGFRVSTSHRTATQRRHEHRCPTAAEREVRSWMMSWSIRVGAWLERFGGGTLVRLNAVSRRTMRESCRILLSKLRRVRMLMALNESTVWLYFGARARSGVTS